MAVNIDDLQLETQESAPTQSTGDRKGGAPPQAPLNIKAELEKQRERDLRLRAD